MTDSTGKSIYIDSYVWWKNNEGQMIYSRVKELNPWNRSVILDDGREVPSRSCEVKHYQMKLYTPPNELELINTNIEGNSKKLRTHIEKIFTDEHSEKRSREWWDNYFLGMAQYVSMASKDPSTKVGAVITQEGKYVVATGYNGFAPNILDSKERYKDRDFKISIILHAEENCIASANSSVAGGTCYTTPFAPCAKCASLLIKYKIKRVVAPKLEDSLKERWGKSLELTSELFKEAGVELVLY